LGDESLRLKVLLQSTNMTQTQYKISKKHHRRINNPFPSAPNSLPLIYSKLTFNHDKLSHSRDFSIGDNFNLTWMPTDGDEGDQQSRRGNFKF
jgi:hypothetical protein